MQFDVYESTSSGTALQRIARSRGVENKLSGRVHFVNATRARPKKIPIQDVQGFQFSNLKN